VVYVEKSSSQITRPENKKILGETTVEKKYFETPTRSGSVFANNVYVENSLNSEDNCFKFRIGHWG